MCLYSCVYMSILWEESIMNNRKEAGRDSVNTKLFACVRVLLCVHMQNGSIFYQRMYCFTLRVCVHAHVFVHPCVCQSSSDPLTWQLFLRECTHPCHYCSTHCWFTAFSTAQEMSVSQSVTLLISSQSQHTQVVLIVPTDHSSDNMHILSPMFYQHYVADYHYFLLLSSWKNKYVKLKATLKESIVYSNYYYWLDLK